MRFRLTGKRDNQYQKLGRVGDYDNPLPHTTQTVLLVFRTEWLYCIVIFNLSLCSCWLSVEKGTIYAFVVPMLLIIIVSFNQTIFRNSL